MAYLKGFQLSLIAIVATFVSGTVAGYPRGNNGCSRIADMAFLLDDSRSINQGDKRNWQTMLRFVTKAVDRLPIGGNGGTRVGLVKFSDLASVEIYLDDYSDKTALKNHIWQVAYSNGSSTKTAQALHLMREDLFREARGDRPDITNVAVVITDGQSTERSQELAEQARKAKDSGIRIVAVGITNAVDPIELNQIASSADDVLRVENFSQLVDALDNMLSMACKNPTPETTAADYIPTSSSQSVPTATTSGMPWGPGYQVQSVTVLTLWIMFGVSMALNLILSIVVIILAANRRGPARDPAKGHQGGPANHQEPIFRRMASYQSAHSYEQVMEDGVPRDAERLRRATGTFTGSAAEAAAAAAGGGSPPPAVEGGSPTFAEEPAVHRSGQSQFQYELRQSQALRDSMKGPQHSAHHPQASQNQTGVQGGGRPQISPGAGPTFGESTTPRVDPQSPAGYESLQTGQIRGSYMHMYNPLTAK